MLAGLHPGERKKNRLLDRDSNRPVGSNLGSTPYSSLRSGPMQFNQVQIRDAIGLSVETFRHWKRVLPPFAERRKYTLGDLLAAGVLRRLTDCCGVRAGRLPEISEVIVEVCNANAWAALSSKTFVIDVQKRTCVLIESASAFPSQDVVVVCPLEGIMVQIQDELLRREPAVTQHHLHFPPTAVRGPRAQRRRP